MQGDEITAAIALQCMLAEKKSDRDLEFREFAAKIMVQALEIAADEAEKQAQKYVASGDADIAAGIREHGVRSRAEDAFAIRREEGLISREEIQG